MPKSQDIKKKNLIQKASEMEVSTAPNPKHTKDILVRLSIGDVFSCRFCIQTIQIFIWKRIIIMENTTLASISHINPFRIVASPSSLPFCSIISDSCILYLCGNHLILENLKTFRQTIIWTCKEDCKLQAIDELTQISGRSKIIVGVNNTLCTIKCAVLFDIDPNMVQFKTSFNSYQLKHIQHYQQIKSLKYVKEATMFAVVSSYANLSTFAIYISKSGQRAYVGSLESSCISINSIEINKNPYCILNSNKQIMQFDLNFFKISHVATISLQDIEDIVQSTVISDGKEEAIGFFRTNLGNLYIGHIKEKLINKIYKIDIKYHQLIPSFFTLLSNKIIVGYPNSNIVVSVAFSTLDYTKTKLTSKDILPSRIIGTTSIVASKDNCHCAFIVTTLSDNIQILYVDIVSSIIDRGVEEEFCLKTFTYCGFAGKVISAEICDLNSVIFVITDRCQIIAYNFIQAEKKSPDRLILWKQSFREQPTKVFCHPLNYNLVLLFEDAVKLFVYNQQKLFPCFFSINITKFTTVCFSPNGEFLVLGSFGIITILNSYSFAVVRKVSLPNKGIVKISFIGKWDMLVQLTNNQVLIIQGDGKVNHLGFVQIPDPDVFLYDQTRDITLLGYKNFLKVMNSEMIETGRVDFQITCQHLVYELQTMFLGTAQGMVHLINWSNSGINFASQPKFQLHSAPIKLIKASMNFKQLFTISVDSSVIISDIVMNQSSNHVRKYISVNILHKSERSFYLCERLLISYSESNQKAEDIAEFICKQGQFYKKSIEGYNEYQKSLEQNLKQFNQQLQQEIEFQMNRSERAYQYKRILAKIDMKRFQIKKFQQIIANSFHQQNVQYQNSIKQIFKIRTQLQQTASQAKEQHQRNIQQLQNIKKVNLNQEIQFQINSQQKMKNIQNNIQREEELKIYNNTIHKCQVEEEYIQNNAFIIQTYDKKIEEINDINQTLVAANRKLATHIERLKQKNSELSIRYAEMEGELQITEDTSNKIIKTKSQLSNNFDFYHSKADTLIKQDKEFLLSTIYERQSTKIANIKYMKLINEIQGSEMQLKELNQQFENLNNKLIYQEKQRQQNTLKIQLAEQKINKLKKRRNETHQQRVVVKIRISNSLHSSNKLMSQKEKMIPMFDKLNQQTECSNKFKNNCIKKYKLFTKKAQQENIKLTYQLNFLKKDQQEKKMRIRQLQDQIQTAKINFKAKEHKITKLKKGPMCLSLYQNADHFVTQI